MFERIRAWADTERLKIVKRINACAGWFTASLAAAYEARPDAVKALLQQIPVWAYFLAAVPFFAIVHYVTKQPKNPS